MKRGRPDWSPPVLSIFCFLFRDMARLGSAPLNSSQIGTGSFGGARRVRDPPDGASGESQENFRFQIDRSLVAELPDHLFPGPVCQRLLRGRPLVPDDAAILDLDDPLGPGAELSVVGD